MAASHSKLRTGSDLREDFQAISTSHTSRRPRKSPPHLHAIPTPAGLSADRLFLRRLNNIFANLRNSAVSRKFSLHPTTQFRFRPSASPLSTQTATPVAPALILIPIASALVPHFPRALPFRSAMLHLRDPSATNLHGSNSIRTRNDSAEGSRIHRSTSRLIASSACAVA